MGRVGTAQEITNARRKSNDHLNETIIISPYRLSSLDCDRIFDGKYNNSNKMTTLCKNCGHNKENHLGGKFGCTHKFDALTWCSCSSFNPSEHKKPDDTLDAIVRDFTSVAFPKIKSDLRSRIQDYAAEREEAARQKYERQVEHGKESGNQSTVYLAGKIEGAQSERERIKKEIEKFYEGADAKLVRKITLFKLI